MRSIAVMGIVLLLLAEPYRIAGAQTSAAVPGDIIGLIAAGKTGEAKRRLQEFRRHNPDNPLAIYYLASIEEDRKTARALLKEAERLAGPDLAVEAAYKRAEMLNEDGLPSEAEEVLAKIVSEHPSCPRYADSLYRLGVIRLTRGDPENALLQFRKCRDTEADPYKKTLARAGIMECHIARRDWNRVIVAAREVLEGRDDASSLTPRVLEALALSWRELGNEENSGKFTRRILTDFPGSYQAHAIRMRSEEFLSLPLSTAGTGQAASDSAGQGLRAPESAETAAVDSGQGTAETGDSEKGTEFSIQAAAYEVRLNALKLYNRLKGAGFPARVEMKTVGEKHRFLVRVGSYKTRAEAEAAANRMTRDTGVKGSVISLR
jgi:cell division septation protein DedD